MGFLRSVRRAVAAAGRGRTHHGVTHGRHDRLHIGKVRG